MVDIALSVKYSVSMNQLDTVKRAAVVRCLVEGNSVRATVRMTGAAKNTVTKLLVELGTACELYHDATFRNLRCHRVQVDEIWSFCYAKQKNLPECKKFDGSGDVWTWNAIDADTKLIVSWLVGGRDGGSAREFIDDVARRLRGRVQLTSDGHQPYVEAIRDSFGGGIDYAVLMKLYGGETGNTQERKYSPGECCGTRTRVVSGSPDPEHISTSFSERQHLTMRMSMRRFTRLTNGFSKKLRNHECAVALHFAHYNLCRKHQTLKTSPAVVAGVTDHVWTVEELVGLLDSNV